MGNYVEKVLHVDGGSYIDHARTDRVINFPVVFLIGRHRRVSQRANLSLFGPFSGLRPGPSSEQGGTKPVINQYPARGEDGRDERKHNNLFGGDLISSFHRNLSPSLIAIMCLNDCCRRQMRVPPRVVKSSEKAPGALAEDYPEGFKLHSSGLIC